jgi:hypothetical protein
VLVTAVLEHLEQFGSGLFEQADGRNVLRCRDVAAPGRAAGLGLAVDGEGLLDPSSELRPTQVLGLVEPSGPESSGPVLLLDVTVDRPSSRAYFSSAGVSGGGLLTDHAGRVRGRGAGHHD